MSNEITLPPSAELVAEALPHVTPSAFASEEGFIIAQRMATLLVNSTLVPEAYRGRENLGNALIALEIAQRVGASPLMVMQNLYIVHGKPGWSAQFIIAALNASRRFSPLRFEITGEGDARTCIAWAQENGTGQRLEGPPVSIKMAKAEGWYGKNGSKWVTLPENMLRYRAATFFGRIYAPDVLMGMHTADELEDITTPPPPSPAALPKIAGQEVKPQPGAFSLDQ